ncbi:MAG: hypothetical protein K6B71_02160 [Alphaproteobacteria bacterium]|nr:hypothetical protein [Alphaproteobacteria bacterium]
MQPDNNAIWDFNNNTWNISGCGDYYWLDHNAIHNYEHCYQGYARSRVSVTFEENKPIYKGRTTDIRLYKIKYGTTANTPEFCCENQMCYEHYDIQWVSSAYSDNACARCVESSPDCPPGFTSQHYPWQCNVTPDTTYTDSTGTFTLSNGSYDPDASEPGYLNNTICPVNNN